MDPRPLNILMVSPEAVPFAKTGGLADVAGALSKELAKLGHRVCLVIPGYDTIDWATQGFKEWRRLTVPTALGPIEAVIEQATLANSGVQVLAVRYDPFFARPGLYQEAGRSYPDNLERFAFFSRAVPELIVALKQERGWVPDLLHAHDWQTALGIVYLRTLYSGQKPCQGIATIFTIHNMGYQGRFPAADYWKTGLSPELFTPKRLEFYGQLNVLKGGLVFADYLTTVSPTYAREIQTAALGFGLEGVIQERQARMIGIVNGIDVDQWNPATDPYVPARYSATDLAGKMICKDGLQREMGLPVRDVPLIGIVSRLTEQKGLDLVADVLPDLMKMDVQVTLLGTGDPSLEARFRTLRTRTSKKIGLRIGFDEGLAHRIEAGSDLFLMPSRYEPCGLSQLYSLRYGTVPVVRRTGGLADTVTPYSSDAVKQGQATGFLFDEPTKAALLTTVLQALRVYGQKDEWTALILAGMGTDVSWAKSARAYVDLYRRVVGMKP